MSDIKLTIDGTEYDLIRSSFNGVREYNGVYIGDTYYKKTLKSKGKDIPKDWQIMSFHCEGCRYKNGLIERCKGIEDCFEGGGTESYHLKNHKIHSIKRLPDMEVFTVGDEINQGLITKITTLSNVCAIHTKDNWYPIGDVEKVVTKPVLVTFDEVVSLFKEQEVYPYGVFRNKLKEFFKSKINP